VQIHRPTVLRVAKGKRSVDADAQRDIQSSPMRGCKALEVEYDERSRRAWSGTSIQDSQQEGHVHMN
jgi:exonuclease V